MTYGIGAVSFQSANLDAFGRLRTSDVISQFEGKFHYGNEEKLFNTTTANGGAATFLSNEAAWNLTTTGTSGSRVLRQSYRYLQYHPGKSQQILLTGVFGAGVANCVKRMGYFDDNDGLFFIQNGVTGFGVTERSSTSGSPVDTIIYQSQWNIDKLNGSGPSGFTLDVTKTNIFVIDFQWLGVGCVKYGVVIDGALIYVHQSNHANNTYTKVYMKSAWLPIRYEIVNVDSSTASELKQICCSVSSEGGMEEVGNLYSIPQTTIVTAGTNAWVPVLSIQVGATLNSQQFRGKIQICDIESLVTSNNPAIFGIFENATLTGASWAAVNAQSAVSYDGSATSMSGGILRMTMMNGKTSANSVISTDELTGYAGSIYTISARGVGGNATVLGSFNWREIV